MLELVTVFSSVIDLMMTTQSVICEEYYFIREWNWMQCRDKYHIRKTYVILLLWSSSCCNNDTDRSVNNIADVINKVRACISAVGYDTVAAVKSEMRNWYKEVRTSSFRL